jgi:excisionase family DNA binding protein
MSELAAAIIDALDDHALDRLAEALAPRLAALAAETSAVEAWLDVDGASRHLICPKSRIYALVSVRRIPFHKDGSRLLFRREELDEWVRAGGGRRP